MDRDPDDRPQPDGGPTPDGFEAIVAGWRSEGQVPAWPDEHPGAARSEPAPVRRPLDEEHFVPPEPPPLPPIGLPAVVGLVLLGLGLVLLVAPGWVGVPTPYGLPLGLVGLASGLGWLVLRLWPDPPSHRPRRDDGDDGAVL